MVTTKINTLEMVGDVNAHYTRLMISYGQGRQLNIGK
jgi:hypothetical protein